MALHCTVGDGSTGGAWIQKLHDFAKSQIAVKFIKSLPQIIWSWNVTGLKNQMILIGMFVMLEKNCVI